MAMTKAKGLIFIYLFITFTCCCSSETTKSGTVNWWCTQTPHYETCNHYVGKPHQLYVGTLSENKFLEMTVRAAIDEGHLVLKQSKGILSRHPNAPGKSLWASCVHYFDGTVFTLNTVLDPNLHPTPLDVQTWLSAGLAYISSCKTGFEMIGLTNSALPIISTNLTQLILNSLAISVVIRDNSNSSRFVQQARDHKLSDLGVEKPNLVVAQDGSGDFRRVQDAINYVGERLRPPRYVIYVKAGIYKEYVSIPWKVWYIKMYGDGINKTIITGGRHLGGTSRDKAGDLKGTATFQVWGRGFIARDMTFRNTAGPQGGQAVALLMGSDHSAFYHCSIEGYQDTLYTIANTQFYKECKIFGTVDFIFGEARAVFQDCEIFLRKPRPSGGLVVTASGRMTRNETGGYSLQGCKISAAADLKPVLRQYNKAFLGRPWHQRGLTVYMQCFLDDLIDPQGWLDSWGYNKTTFCGEYNNYGPGSSTDQRVNWRGYHTIQKLKTANHFTVTQFLLGNHWLPSTGVPYKPGL